jgi:hypothetical protein
MESKEVTSDMHMEEAMTQQKIQKTIEDEDETWRLKSRSLWLKNGDKNTKFFDKKEKDNVYKNNLKDIFLEDG